LIKYSSSIQKIRKIDQISKNRFLKEKLFDEFVPRLRTKIF